MKIYNQDCLDKLKELDNNSIDSIITDPPYGLSFMGKKWDYDVPSVDIWIECLRVLKSGGYLLAFAGSRTYHRMAGRFEDAGVEIRDQIMWIYGSGFPKSHNIGKAVDKLQGNEREYVGKKMTGRGKGGFKSGMVEMDETKGNSPYEGWGTALKPAHEPIVMARKPFKGTVAQNVLEWGTGGINIDGCRVGNETMVNQPAGDNDVYNTSWKGTKIEATISEGRFPANIIFDEEAGKILDEQSSEASRFFYCSKTSKKDRNEGCDELEEKEQAHSTNMRCGNCNKLILSGNGDSCKCENKLEVRHKAKNHHPTVKPTDLMLYLIRLVTPKGKTTLDPFMGSGSTGKAAIRGGFDFIGIEREKEYYDIAKARIKYEQEKQKPDPQQKLF